MHVHVCGSSRSVFFCADPETFKNILRERPQELIRFTMFRRAPEKGEIDINIADKRMLRVKNAGRMPVGVWANWLCQSKFQFTSFCLFSVERSRAPFPSFAAKTFSGAVLAMIFLNAVLLGVQQTMPLDNWRVRNWTP